MQEKFSTKTQICAIISTLILALAVGCVDNAESTKIQATSAAQVTISVPVVPAATLDSTDSGGLAVPRYPTAQWEGLGLGRRNLVNVPLTGLLINSTINQISARVADSTQDGCFFALYDQLDGAFRGPGGRASAFSNATHALGTWTTISLQAPVSLLVASGHAYSVVLYMGTLGPCWINAVEVTYTPPL